MSARAFLVRTFLVRSVALAAALASALLSAQSKPVVSNPALVREFPVTMSQNVVAGRTPVGANVKAKLIIATLLNGSVIPIGATFTGEVVASAAKSATAPSRLAIRMDSVHWKKGSADLKVYLTAWYYPATVAAEDLFNEATDGIHGPIGIPRGTSRRNAPAAQPSSPDTSSGPTSNVSDRRIAMKDIDSVHLDDGALAITSARLNIKLDKVTTYVLASGDLTPAK